MLGIHNPFMRLFRESGEASPLGTPKTPPTVSLGTQETPPARVHVSKWGEGLVTTPKRSLFVVTRVVTTMGNHSAVVTFRGNRLGNSAQANCVKIVREMLRDD